MGTMGTGRKVSIFTLYSKLQRTTKKENVFNIRFDLSSRVIAPNAPILPVVWPFSRPAGERSWRNRGYCGAKLPNTKNATRPNANNTKIPHTRGSPAQPPLIRAPSLVMRMVGGRDAATTGTAVPQ